MRQIKETSAARFTGNIKIYSPYFILQRHTYECEHYLPRYWRRFDTLPGLTGFWQVNGKNRTTFEQMMYWDIRYAEEKSLALDIGIVLRTIANQPAIAPSADAYHVAGRGTPEAENEKAVGSRRHQVFRENIFGNQRGSAHLPVYAGKAP